MKVAIVCDWLVGVGGAERVVLELHKMFPEAPIYTSQYDPSGIDWFNDAVVRTTWLQKLPRGLRKFLPVLRAQAFSHLDLSDYDLIISASGAEAKGVQKRPGAVHISYCHTPTHYYWIRYDEYLANPGFGALNFLARLGLRLLVGPMRRWDYKAAQRPDVMLANSTFTKDNIKKYYHRDSKVVFPPVDISRFAGSDSGSRSGFVVTGRQAPYKRIDLAVAACSKLNLPLSVIGDGPEHPKLKAMAGSSIKFVTDADDSQVASYLKSATAFIFPGLEDFGISGVEALAAGTPLIAYHGGGAKDYVLPGRNGEFFLEQTTESLVEVLQNFDPGKYSAQQVAESAQKFKTAEFISAIKSAVAEATKSLES